MERQKIKSISGGTVRQWTPGKIVLIYPASRRYSGYMSTNRYPLLFTAHAGLPILAEILERGGHTVEVLDDSVTPVGRARLESAALVGISVETLWANRGYGIAAMAREMNIPVVFGGAHATLNPDDALEHGDYVVRNEGEKTFPELLEALRNGTTLEAVRGISFRADSGRAIHNEARPFLTTQEMDDVPWPKLTRIQGWDSPANLLGRYIYFTMISRGCPFHCNFCSITPEFGKLYRHRSVDDVIDELQERFDYKRQFLFFMDDSISGDKEYLKALLDRMLTKGVYPRMGWHSQMRADTAKDKALMKLMQRTNCFFATFGFESIDENTLRYMRKGQNLKLIEECIETMRKHDILVNGFFMFGSDHETRESIGRTVDFALKHCAIAGFMPMTPFPGTPFFEDLDRQGRIFTKHWELYDVQHVVFWPKHMTPYELYMGCLNAYRRFYTDQRSLFTVKMRGAVPKLCKVLQPWNPLSYLRSQNYIWSFLSLWPLFKLVDYSKEVLANLDYILYLKSLKPGETREFRPNMGAVQDLLTWRRAKGILARSNGEGGRIAA